MRHYGKWATAGVALAMMGVLAGCGTANNSVNPTSNATSSGAANNLTGVGHAKNINNTASSNTTAENTPTTGANTASPSSNLTLENVQVIQNSMILTTTHGNMQTAYQNPVLTNGVFTVTLVKMDLAPSLSAHVTYTSNGLSYNFAPNGSNLVLTVRFGSNSPGAFQTDIGGGDMIGFTFQAASQTAGFRQTFHWYGGTGEVFLTHNLGFQVVDMGGGLGNFEYQFSKTTNGGNTWTKLSVGHYTDVQGVSFINEQTGYFLNNSPDYSITPNLFVTHDGGVTWTEQKLPIPSAYSNYFRMSNYPIFITQQVGFIPIYGDDLKESTTRFLYMLVTTNGGSSWTAYTGTGNQPAGLKWTLIGDKLTVTRGTKTLTVKGLFSIIWSVTD